MIFVFSSYDFNQGKRRASNDSGKRKRRYALALDKKNNMVLIYGIAHIPGRSGSHARCGSSEGNQLPVSEKN